MNSWDVFKHYEEQQRKSRETVTQQRLAERERQKQHAEEQRALREQERRNVEQRQAAQREEARQHTTEQQRLADEVRRAVLSQIASSLHSANEQVSLAQQQAQQQRKEARSTVKGNPMEQAFKEAWEWAYPSIPLLPQYPISRYRVDFAHVETQTAIELDGHAFHSQKRDRNRDYARQHEIENQGWYILRFTGSQVFHDVESCIQLAHSRIMAR